MRDTERVRAHLRRARELERRAFAGVDNLDYCIRWAGLHRKLARLAMPR